MLWRSALSLSRSITLQNCSSQLPKDSCIRTYTTQHMMRRRRQTSISTPGGNLPMLLSGRRRGLLPPCLVVAVVVVLSAASVPRADAYKNYTVGDDKGWYDGLTLPGVDYQEWADGDNFSLGDFLSISVHRASGIIHTRGSAPTNRSTSIMHGSWFQKDGPNGSKAVSLLLRLSTLGLALSSAVLMVTASECTISELNGVTVTVTYKHYPAFVYLVGFNIAAAILEAAAIYLQLSKGDADDEEWGGKLPGILLVAIDVAAQALLYSSTGAVYAYGGQLSAGRFCEQVQRSKLFSLAASFSVGLAAVVKDVPLPFSVWANPSL